MGKIGKQTYLEKVHPSVITNLYSSHNKITASAASIVLVGSIEELGISVTVQQVYPDTIHTDEYLYFDSLTTILMKQQVHCFGKGLLLMELKVWSG